MTALSNPPGLSLATYVRDRTGYLAQSLRHWQAAPEIAEIVVVDYGSTPPVTPAVFRGDRRCRLIRVENAAYWKQGKAENLAIAEATGPLILKLDADTYIPAEKIPALLTLQPCQFVSGSPTGSKSGQALFWKSDWAAAGGYHEFMSGWGHDDHDFYRRLLAAGLERLEFGDDTLWTIEHEDHLRSAGGLALPRRLGIAETVLRHKEFANVRNKVLAYLMPWEASLRETPARLDLGFTGPLLALGRPGALEEAAVELASFFSACLFTGRPVEEMAGGLAAFFGPAEEMPAEPAAPARAVAS